MEIEDKPLFKEGSIESYTLPLYQVKKYITKLIENEEELSNEEEE